MRQNYFLSIVLLNISGLTSNVDIEVHYRTKISRQLMIFTSPNFRVKSEGTVLKLRVRWGEFCQIQHCSGDGGRG